MPRRKATPAIPPKAKCVAITAAPSRRRLWNPNREAWISCHLEHATNAVAAVREDLDREHPGRRGQPHQQSLEEGGADHARVQARPP